VLDRPRIDQPHYGRHLGDAGYWSPYVAVVLARHHLPASELETPLPELSRCSWPVLSAAPRFCGLG